jgi:uncharacterized protein YjbI with pentapeptide repeats
MTNNPQVINLIALLGNPDYQRRQQGAQLLQTLGPGWLKEASGGDISVSGEDLIEEGKVSLFNADLRGVDLSNMNLEGVDFSYADIRGTNLRGSNIDNTSFRRAFFDENTKLPEQTGYYFEKEWDIRGRNPADLVGPGANIEGGNWRYDPDAEWSAVLPKNVNVRKARFRSVDFSGRDLSGWDFAGAQVKQSILKGTNLEGANLPDSYWWDVKLEGASFKNAWMNGSKFVVCDMSLSDLSGASWQDAHLRNMTLNGVNLKGTNMAGSDWGISFLGDKRSSWLTGRAMPLNTPIITPLQWNEDTVWPSNSSDVYVTHGGEEYTLRRFINKFRLNEG